MSRRQFTLRSLLALIVGLSFAIGCAAMVARHYSTVTKRQVAEGKFRTIIGVLRNYDAAHGRLPPAFARDATGRATSSWRFLLLPEMGGPWGDFDALWNGPANQHIAKHPAEVYCFGSMVGPPETRCMTNMLAVTGPSSRLDFENAHSLSELNSDTILLVETNTSRVHWMQPGDLNVNDIPIDENDCESVGISGNCCGGFFVAFADGDVWLLSRQTPLTILRRFFDVHRSRSESRSKALSPFLLWSRNS